MSSSLSANSSVVGGPLATRKPGRQSTRLLVPNTFQNLRSTPNTQAVLETNALKLWKPLHIPTDIRRAESPSHDRRVCVVIPTKHVQRRSCGGFSSFSQHHKDNYLYGIDNIIIITFYYL